MSDFITKVRITDPDFVDRIRVELKNTKKGGVVGKPWRLGNYQSTGIVDLKGGKYFLSIHPYIDPLPVWFKVYNTGMKKLLVKCVLSELQLPGSKQFKDIGIVKPNQWLYVPATTVLEYRVERFKLGRLDIMKLGGVETNHLRKLNEARIINVEDLVKVPLSTLNNIFGEAEAINIYKRAKTLDDALVSASTFSSLEYYHVKTVAHLRLMRIAQIAGTSQEEARIFRQILIAVVGAVKEPLLKVPLYIGDLFDGGM